MTLAKAGFRKNYYYKIIGPDGKTVDYRKAHSHRKRSFLRQMRLVKTKKGSKYYLKVSYGRHEDVWGKMTRFSNEGWYDSKKDFYHAFYAFDELDESDFE